MGGTVSKALGISSGGSAPQPAQPAEEKTVSRVSETDMGDVVRRRRRAARALLSDTRLNPEQGIGQSTLGVGQM